MAEATVGLLRAVLTANTAQFEAGMGKAAGKVEGFDATTKAAQRSIARLVGDFRGDKLVAEAAKMAAAIDKVGGVSKLTDAELARVNRTLDAAAAKFRTLGQEVPADVARLRTEIAALDRAGNKAAGAGGGLGQLQGVVGSLGKLLPALSVAGVVGGVLTLGAAALASADKFVTFSTRAGVSIETAQRWDYVASQTSTSLEAFANATAKLGINIGTGTSNVRAAVDELGLSYRELRQLAPEEQFTRVVGALEGVERITDRNRLGTALFGKQFGEIAVAIEEGYTDIARAATVAGEDQVRAAEAAGDALEKLKQAVSAKALQVFGRLAQEFTDTARSVDDLTAEQLQHYRMLIKTGGDAYGYLLELERERVRGMRDIELKTETVATATADYVAQLAAVRAEVSGLTAHQKQQIDAALRLGGVTDELADAVGVSTDALRLYQEQARDATERTRKADEAAKAFAASVRTVPVAFRGWVTIPQTVNDTKAAIDDVRASTEAMAGVDTDLGDMWVPFRGNVVDSQKELSKLEQRVRIIAGLKAELGEVLQSIPQTIAQAFVSGGDMGGAMKAVTSQLGSKLAQMGAAALGFAGPWGQAIAGAVGAMAPMISKLWGGNAEHRKVNDLRDGFVSAAGGIHALNVKAQEAGLTLDRLLRAKTVKDYEAAVNELNAAFERQARVLEENKQAANDLFDEIMAAGANGIPASFQPAIEKLIELGLLTDEQIAKLRGLNEASMNLEKMRSAIEVFKGRIDSLGPAFKAAQIIETSKQYLDALETMKAGGADMGMVLTDAKEELSALVQEAMKSGAALPENMRPYIEALIASGELVDANGEKITDISKIKFGPAVKTQAEVAKEGWDKLLEKIEELIAKIGGGLNSAIDHATRDRTTNVDVNFRERRNDEGYGKQPEGDAGAFKVGTKGRLGRWFGNFGRGTRATLDGVEAVVTPRQAVPFALDTLRTSLPALAESAALAAATRAGASAGPMTAHVQLLLDGRRLAEALVPILPGAIRRHGVVV